MDHQQLVVPGQLIAVSSIQSIHDNSIKNTEDSFLRGHGTYIETTGTEQRLYASTTGIIQRINKLISVQPISNTTFYRGQVGDLIVGRITQVLNSGRWKVDLGSGRPAILPLQGIHLPGGAQRVRTAEDALEMRLILREGDLVSAEVHKIAAPSGGGVVGSGSSAGDGAGIVRLHTRSSKYGKLENGCLVVVPPALIPRRKNHYVDIIDEQFQILWGCNGMVWIQRNVKQGTGVKNSQSGSNSQQHMQTQDLLVELQEQRRKDHRNMPYSKEERSKLARLRNSIECIKLVQQFVTTEAVERLFHLSIQYKMKIADMLLPDNIIKLTEYTRT